MRRLNYHGWIRAYHSEIIDFGPHAAARLAGVPASYADRFLDQCRREERAIRQWTRVTA